MEHYIFKISSIFKIIEFKKTFKKIKFDQKNMKIPIIYLPPCDIFNFIWKGTPFIGGPSKNDINQWGL